MDKKKILMFEMSLSGSARCWYLTLSDTIKKDFEILLNNLTMTTYKITNG